MLDLGQFSTHRRGFITRVAGAIGLAAVAPSRLFAEPSGRGEDPQLEAWFNRITGKHRMVFDATAPNGGMPAIWPRIYLNTMHDTYPTPDADDTAVVIGTASPELILEAAEACPAVAITVVDDETGETVFP